jgi:hypothetical protein
MVTKESLKKYVMDNPKLVTMRESTSMPGVFVLKYKKSVFYNDSWDDFLEHCRGSVVDKDFNLISYPFQKIYNYGIEARAPKLSDDTEVIAYRKVNGFMVSASYYNGDILVSTTGSTDSDYVRMAKEMMLTHMDWTDWQLTFNRSDMDNLTVMFECVHPDDPHIIPEKAGMYVLGFRDNNWRSRVGHSPGTLELMGKAFNCYVPEVYRVTLGELKAMAKECKHEGFVFYTRDGISAKIKSPYYLTSKWVARNPRTDKLVDLNKDIKHNLDEEYYPLVDAIRANIVEYTAMDEQARLAWVREQLA